MRSLSPGHRNRACVPVSPRALPVAFLIMFFLHDDPARKRMQVLPHIYYPMASYRILPPETSLNPPTGVLDCRRDQRLLRLSGPSEVGEVFLWKLRL